MDKNSTDFISAKREREKELVSEMIALYCRKKHGSKDGLCPECAELNEYACRRTDRCPYMETKTFCSKCQTHCYSPKMREKIKEIMRFSGPRMTLYHPVLALRHAFESMKS